MKRLFAVLAVFAFAVGGTPALAKAKAAKPALPTYFTIPAALKATPDTLTQEDFGEAEFWARKNGQDVKFVKQGKHWHSDMVLQNPPAGADGKAAWAPIKAALIAGGWTIPDEWDSNPYSVTMHYQKDGKDTYGYMQLFAPDDIRLDLVEAGGAVATLALTPPAATPEKVSPDKGDFPYLSPLPGSTFHSGGHDTGAMMVTLPGSDEAQVVGTGMITKYYAPAPGLSTIAFVQSYDAAFKKAGWTIIAESGGLHQSDAEVTAHYAKNGRNIWAYLHFGGGDEYSIEVSDSGAASDLSAQLAKTCHVALYGVLFDFNKATLKPESDATLQTVLAILQKQAALKVEVQGHTDNVGGDAYNQTLSEARAKSVMAWLTGHGIAANRLTFKGYGKTHPVASNDNDEGRAKNRRVEIANLGCQPSK